jgi:hypothetical protein
MCKPRSLFHHHSPRKSHKAAICLSRAILFWPTYQRTIRNPHGAGALSKIALRESLKFGVRMRRFSRRSPAHQAEVMVEAEEEEA